MKSLLLLGIITLFFGQENSYNFTGNYMKKDDLLTIDVRDGAYWVTFVHKTSNGGAPCEFSEKASVKNGMLRIQVRQQKQVISLIINRLYNDGNAKVIVQGLKKEDRDRLTHFCNDSLSLAGDYPSVP